VGDPEVLKFLQQQGSTAKKFVASVCGGLFLAKAGLLQGYPSGYSLDSTRDQLRLGVEVGTERVVIDRNRITVGRHGIDFGLTIAEMLYGERNRQIAQLLIEYNPAPPFDADFTRKSGS